ncbi:hypothetical protein [Novipirellula artificiosorum]|uniref:Lipoprotein n=1 Tax=Novipirellula artificiosorum TaxID=2528016 RepID=A0A5C6DRJ5_9BACT|nr:hypothetical protein [Novipirellula artificiosorum]TWU39460.1 hypothetical protein Poly41_22840 [Novipirellula artificiosorum]
MKAKYNRIAIIVAGVMMLCTSVGCNQLPWWRKDTEVMSAQQYVDQYASVYQERIQNEPPPPITYSAPKTASRSSGGGGSSSGQSCH